MYYEIKIYISMTLLRPDEVYIFINPIYLYITYL